MECPWQLSEDTQLDNSDMSTFSESQNFRKIEHNEFWSNWSFSWTASFDLEKVFYKYVPQVNSGFDNILESTEINQRKDNNFN